MSIEHDQPLPAVQLRSATYHPFIYRKMVQRADATARPGDLVAVHDRAGALFGYGLYNPRSEIAIRMLTHGPQPPGESFWQHRIDTAVALRRDQLELDKVTNAYRVVHAEADGLPGLVVDRLGDTLSAEAFSLGMFQRAGGIMDRLATACGTRHTILRVDEPMHGREGFLTDAIRSPEMPDATIISEHGTRFRVRFRSGHKTGFFCDQRDNRRRLAELGQGRSVLDLCCYTGGFAVQAKRLGGAGEVTGVDLDEDAVALATENAQLNQLRIRFVHADVFAYMRDMLATSRAYDIVVLDPPKLIRSRREIREGTRKHFDLNRLALRLVRPGGILLSCSCSGLLPEGEFLRLLNAAARQAAPPEEAARGTRPGRSLQILARTGAAPDHPVSPDCPETEYLKAVWLRVL